VCEICGGRSESGAMWSPSFKFCSSNHHFTHLSPPHEVCDISGQAAQYHILSLEVSGFISLTLYLTGYAVIKFCFYHQQQKNFVSPVRNMFCVQCILLSCKLWLSPVGTLQLLETIIYSPCYCFVNYVLCTFISLFEGIMSAA
jgi:hypothetical protein